MGLWHRNSRGLNQYSDVERGGVVFAHTCPEAGLAELLVQAFLVHYLKMSGHGVCLTVKGCGLAIFRAGPVPAKRC